MQKLTDITENQIYKAENPIGNNENVLGKTENPAQ
jgi:hypothetical protein